MRTPSPRLQCFTFKRLLTPYASGELGALQPRAYERLRRHLGGCAYCRADVKACATTHYRLSMEARQVRQGESVAVSKSRSIADRVMLEVTALEENSRVKRMAGRRLAYALAALAFLLMMIMQPSHAREWIYGKLFGLALTSAVVQPIRHTHRARPAPFPNRDPFAVGVDSNLDSPVAPPTTN